MELLSRILLTCHIVAGFLSLALFILPLIIRKGKGLHKTIGRIYVKTMWIVLLSAFCLSIINLVNARYFTAAFLGYLSILTAHPLWYGIAVLNWQSSDQHKMLLKRRTLEWIIFLLALLNIGVFIYLQGKGQSVLLLIFGILGLFAGSGIFYRKEQLIGGINRIKDHISSMITSGIAAYTAFFAFGGYTFFESSYDGYTVVVFWTLPGILGSILIAYYQRKWAIPEKLKTSSL